MRMKYAFFSLLTALVMFLTGVLSGHYYAYHQWGQLHQEEGETIAFVTDEDPAEEGVENDLRERQEDVKESGSTNFFSQLGQTLGGNGSGR
ncbi:hypothetical protein [Natribacillus halophilus]|uniref:Uncharacterized protein n=1 Tax=Natribacillus halophilus TaxID=549003 RepID=A0A1G8JTG3_9BACI|nr:hypothetical protein [Natribacillus halophilus]SDI34519.1 hypothetical protein SAMN04488123_101389 [Natribacillus halophilus]